MRLNSYKNIGLLSVGTISLYMNGYDVAESALYVKHASVILLSH